MAETGPLRTIFIVSDSTGETAEKMVRAALRQFDLHEAVTDLRLIPHLRHELDMDVVVGNAQRTQGLVVSTLVRGEERKVLQTKCEQRGVPYVDLIGSLQAPWRAFCPSSHAKCRGCSTRCPTAISAVWKRSSLRSRVTMDAARKI